MHITGHGLDTRDDLEGERMHSLSFELAVRPGESSGGITRRDTRYWAAAIDEEPIAELVARALGHRGDWSGRLAPEPAEWLRSGIAMYLGEQPADLASGRVPVLVCAECGDLACGAIAVRIDDGASSVVWSDFAYENTYEDPDPFEVGTFEFDRPTYESTIRRLLSDSSRSTSGQA